MKKNHTPYFAASNWCWEHPQILIPPVWDRAERSARDAGERCIVYPCILNATLSAASLISDIPRDMTDALKARIHHHPSFGVNLKVAALWMSTPSHVDLFKCHRSLFCNCGARQTKGEGVAKEEGKRCWQMSFFLSRKAKWHTISKAQQVFHLTLEEEYGY